MIPQRVYMKGFMSYRDETTLSFRGSSLWVLAGRNGAGKSAVFDAMTFALYGAHRGGEQHAKILINKQCDGFVVEFDFIVGDDEYRVRRTCSQKRSTYQAIHLQGPHAPQPGKPGPQAIPDTDKLTGFNLWVAHVVGLSFETFTASVLLRQNESDVLLTVGASNRHDMLTQLVNLSAYVRLCEQADEKRKRLEQEATLYQGHLQRIAPVNDAQLASLSAQIEQANIGIQEMLARLGRLSALKVKAERWNQWRSGYTLVQQALCEIHATLDQAEQIEYRARRLSTLQQVLPSLQLIAVERREFAEKERYIIQYRDDLCGWVESQARARIERESAQVQRDDLAKQREEVGQDRELAQATLNGLQEDVNMLHQLAAIRAQVDEYRQRLSSVSEDLEQRHSVLQQEVEALKELQVAIPWLEHFAEARAVWHQASLAYREAQRDAEALTTQAVLKQNEKRAVEDRLQAVQQEASQAQQYLTECNTLLAVAKKNLRNFQEVDSQAKCRYCGQMLTPQHLDDERTRLEEELKIAQDAVETARQRSKETNGRGRTPERERDAITDLIQALQSDAQRMLQEQLKAQQTLTSEEHKARKALSSLPPTHREKIATGDDETIDVIFACDYPTAATLSELRLQAQQVDEKSGQLSLLSEQRHDREKLLAEQSLLLRQQQGLEERYPTQREHDILLAFQQEQQRLDVTSNKRKELHSQLKQAEQQLEQAQATSQQADQQVQAITITLKTEEGKKETLQVTLVEQVAALPVSWQTAAEAMTEEQVTGWQREIEQLAGADHLYEQLEKARQERQSLEQRKQHLEQEMDTIEPEARRPLSIIEQEERCARQEYEKVNEELQQAQLEKRTLEICREQHLEYETHYHQARRKALLYKRLAQLLGRDHLQNYLLLQAQTGIVASANETLDRISAGTLRIELRQREEQGAAKALDLIAHNSETGAESLPVSQLSGSQKFRVAVSLAIGIGRHASHGTRQIESVIIDEGFGGLDKEGRQDMIQELHLLKGELKRIILVSHQEEFVDAFDNGYTIELIDQTSKVTLR
jgi:DNA repair exonuclease SbcCD ATPase subunit